MRPFLTIWLSLVLLFSCACSLLSRDDLAAMRANAQDAYDVGAIDEAQYHRILNALAKEEAGTNLVELLAIFLGGAAGGAGAKPMGKGVMAVGRGVRAVARKISQKQVS